MPLGWKIIEQHIIQFQFTTQLIFYKIIATLVERDHSQLRIQQCINGIRVRENGMKICADPVTLRYIDPYSHQTATTLIVYCYAIEIIRDLSAVLCQEVGLDVCITFCEHFHDTFIDHLLFS